MPKVKFTITGEFPSEDVLVFAKARGYQETVAGGVDDDGQPILSLNPESPEAFVSRYIKAILVREVAGATEAKIRADIEQQLHARLGGLHNSVQGVISIRPEPA